MFNEFQLCHHKNSLPGAGSRDLVLELKCAMQSHDYCHHSRQQARERRVVRRVHQDLQRVLLALLLAARLDLALHLARHVVEEAPEAEAADFFGFVWGRG